MSDSDKQSNTGPIVVLSGPSGCGKTTVVERLVRESPVALVKAVSATTRPPRSGEVHGHSYYFLADDEFRRKLEDDEFLEHAEVFLSGYLYGTLNSELHRAWVTPAWAFLEIDVQGAMEVMQQYPQAVTIFLKTPSPEEFERRLRARGTETEDMIRNRLATSARELQYASRYSYVVVNEELDQAVDEICEILKSEETQSHAG